MNNLMLAGMWLRTKLNKLLRDERGEVNIVAMVVLIGVAVILAIVFKNAIDGLITRLVGAIETKAKNDLDL